MISKYILYVVNNNLFHVASINTESLDTIYKNISLDEILNDIKSFRNCYIQSNYLRLVGSQKKYTLEIGKDKAVVVSKTSENKYICIFQNDRIAKLNYEQLLNIQLLNAKLVNKSVVLIKGTLQKGGIYHEQTGSSNNSIQSDSRCNTGLRGFPVACSSREIQQQAEFNRTGTEFSGSLHVQQENRKESDTTAVLLHARHVNAKSFLNAITEYKNTNKHSTCVDIHDISEYKHMKCFLCYDNKAGMAIEKDGNIVSVFKQPSSNEKGFAVKSVKEAIRNGATKLDCYDINGFLPNQYMKAGMIPVCKIKFNKEFAPEGWNFEQDGEPDIVFMMKGETDKNFYFEYSDDEVPYIYDNDTTDAYTLATQYRDKLINETKKHQTNIDINNCKNIKEVFQRFSTKK